MMEGVREDEEGETEATEERWQSPTTGQSVLISVCNKESETLGPREDMVHLVSALTRSECVCVCLRSKATKYADACILHTEMPMGVYRNE